MSSLADGLRRVSTAEYAETSGAEYTVTDWAVREPSGELTYFGDDPDPRYSKAPAERHAEQGGGRVVTRTVTVTVPSWQCASDTTSPEG